MNEEIKGKYHFIAVNRAIVPVDVYMIHSESFLSEWKIHMVTMQF